jgi:hypothetical protein
MSPRCRKKPPVAGAADTFFVWREVDTEIPFAGFTKLKDLLFGADLASALAVSVFRAACRR